MKILYPFWYCTLGLYIKKTIFLLSSNTLMKPIFYSPPLPVSFPSPTLKDSASPSKRTSVSSFQSTVDSDSAASISLNVELDNVNFHIKKPSKYPHVPPHPADQKGRRQSPSGIQTQAGQLGHRSPASLSLWLPLRPMAERTWCGFCSTLSHFPHSSSPYFFFGWFLLFLVFSLRTTTPNLKFVVFERHYILTAVPLA